MYKTELGYETKIFKYLMGKEQQILFGHCELLWPMHFNTNCSYICNANIRTFYILYDCTIPNG